MSTYNIVSFILNYLGFYDHFSKISTYCVHDSLNNCTFNKVPEFMI